jgi:hypothetical protein
VAAADSLASCRAEIMFSIFWNILSVAQLAKAARVCGAADHATGQAMAFAREYLAHPRCPVVLHVARNSGNGRST